MWRLVANPLVAKMAIGSVVIVTFLAGAYYLGYARATRTHQLEIAEAVQEALLAQSEEQERQSQIAKRYLEEQSKRLENAGTTIRILTNDLKELDTSDCPTLPDGIMQKLNALRGHSETTGDTAGTMPSTR